jgi:sec-independent protein translocase protein TatA
LCWRPFGPICLADGARGAADPRQPEKSVFNLGWTEILIIVLIVVLLFGRGKISGMMGDVAKGIKSFRKGMSEDDEPPAKAPDNRQLGQDASLSDVTPRKDDAAKT